jgi:hypothetical protein
MNCGVTGYNSKNHLKQLQKSFRSKVSKPGVTGYNSKNHLELGITPKII